jgi:catechol 2,3-dioxygenase-like lactoylglutathione lyase family enzyme
MTHRINGFQHIGVAVSDMERSLRFYRKFFGLNIPFFDAVAAAPLMLPYTNQEVITKRASMIMNLMGGCAMEVIQATSFEPRKPIFTPQLGDLGIFITRVKCPDINAAHQFCLAQPEVDPTPLRALPDGGQTFFIFDLDGNCFQYVEGRDWYTSPSHLSGGVMACTIGVSDLNVARNLYGTLLGYDRVIYEHQGTIEEWAGLPGGEGEFHRVLLGQSDPPGGGFAKVTGATFIELVQAKDRTPKRIFDQRIWADIGFVHLGLDVRGMSALGAQLQQAGFGFTCDSQSALDMGNTKVHCTYIEDADQTWIELIEVHKVPIVERWGLYLNVSKRDPMKPLPDFMLKALRFSRIKD